MSEENIPPLVKETLAAASRMKTERSTFDSVCQEIKEYVRPNGGDVIGNTQPGSGGRKQFDPTAPWCVDQLASGLHTYLSNPVDRWFSLGLAGIPQSQLTFKEKDFLDKLTDYIYAKYGAPDSFLHSSLHECYLEVASYGTMAVYQGYDVADKRVYFRAYPYSCMYYEEDHTGKVSEVQRHATSTKEQVLTEFYGDGKGVPEKLQKASPGTKFTVIHSVKKRLDKTGKAGASSFDYQSVYVLKELSLLLKESGYHTMPYHIARWSKVSGETYGRSPAMAVLSDIRMVNAMGRSMIIAAQKQLDPPIAVDDDSFLLPLNRNPSAVNYRRPGSAPIEAIPTSGNPVLTTEEIAQRRQSIREGFYVDWLIRTQKRERQTAQEIVDERNQMLSMLGPVVGRFEAEFYGPLIRTSIVNVFKYEAEEINKYMGEVPERIKTGRLDISYISPAARAQTIVRGQGMSAFIMQLANLLPLFPGLHHGVDKVGLLTVMQDLNDAPREVLIDPKEAVAAMDEEKQQQQQMMLADAAPKMAKAAKDFSQSQLPSG